MTNAHNLGAGKHFCPEHNESMVNIKVVPSRYKLKALHNLSKCV